MARRWTAQEEREKYGELFNLYVRQNKTMKEAGALLGLKENSIYTRLLRLNIPVTPDRKIQHLNRRRDIILPTTYNTALAEVIGIMLGDGHISDTQIRVTIYQKESQYIEYVSKILRTVFGVTPTQGKWNNSHVCDVYIGSTAIVRYLEAMGLVHNKVQEQVHIPQWVATKKTFMEAFLRGFFDTDGSLYKLRFGTQMSFCNRSLPLLEQTKNFLEQLEYHPSRISGYNLYITRKEDLKRYAKEIGFGNLKHFSKAEKFGIVV